MNCLEIGTEVPLGTSQGSLKRPERVGALLLQN